MGKISNVLWGAAIGAGMMYFMDPQQGNRRKAMVRDQMYHLRSKGDEALDTAMNDLRNRARGILAEGMAIVSNETMPDYIMEERVRSRLGMLTRHPGAIRVSVQNGAVMLEGDVLKDEEEALTRQLGKVRGVHNVESRLRAHETAQDIPQLQGECWLPGQNGRQWRPSTRLIAGAGAGYLLLYSMMRGGLIGFAARLGGLFLGARALTNMNTRQLTGKGIDQGVIQVRKSIQINAPVEEVYALWSNFENFPRFMQNIESIQMAGDRSHWVVKGPAGSKVEFDALTTAMVPNELVSWETTPESMVKHQGQVRFRESGGGTQVSVNMYYTPPAGAVGHAVASLFGKDPRSEMNADLVRMKGLLEQGRTTAGGRKVNREEVTGGKGSGQKPREESRQQRSQRVPVTGTEQSEFSKKELGSQPGDDDVTQRVRRDMGGGEENTPGGQR